MARFNPEFWEIPTSSSYLESVASERALWYETEEDREHRYAQQEFFKSVLPAVNEIMNSSLTARQKQVLQLYFLKQKTQEDIAAMLNLSQSTVSRHLFGTVRNGRKVGGAIPKLQKAIERTKSVPIQSALSTLRARYGLAS
ncbi:MAG: hypothetical protein AMXMBFR84_51060 [Candidatus Hydrogenedentota bacterium]